MDLPWQDTKHQVEHEKGANNDERDEVEPVPVVSHCIISLKTMKILYVVGYKCYL